MRYEYVKTTLQRLITEGTLSTDDSILAVCAGEAEWTLFREIGITNVTISNLDERMSGSEFAPLKWSYQNAERLTFPDASFDFVFDSDGLHHCESPHAGLLEMYRVARKGIIAFEARDSLLMRLANHLGFAAEYELEAVVDHNFNYGGVNNSGIPNFIYRWTERELLKTLRSYDPTARHECRFFYGLNLPYVQAELRKNPLKYYFFIRVIEPFLRLATALFKKQRNSFGMVVLKRPMPERLHPWLEETVDGIRVRRDYAAKYFKVKGG